MVILFLAVFYEKYVNTIYKNLKNASSDVVAVVFYKSAEATFNIACIGKNTVRLYVMFLIWLVGKQMVNLCSITILFFYKMCWFLLLQNGFVNIVFIEKLGHAPYTWCLVNQLKYLYQLVSPIVIEVFQTCILYHY